jgi:hypothetical protein
MKWETGNPSAEQHALDNPGHPVLTRFDKFDEGDGNLCIVCIFSACNWWDEQLIGKEDTDEQEA